MRQNCRYPGEVICIKRDKYGSMYVPKEEKAPKEGKKPSGDSALDQIREDIERMKDESIKKNRDNLDALYNIDMRNMSASMKRLFASWSDGIKDVSASVETIANSQEAVVNLVAKYDDSIAALQVKAEENEASITQLVEVIGEDGEKISASIQVAIKNDRSFIQAVADEVEISADEINLSGYVKFDNLKTPGGSVIDGNNISLIMDGSNDRGNNTFDGTSYLTYEYADPVYGNSVMGYIRSRASGTESDETSRYSLEIRTRSIFNADGTQVYPAIKLYAVGRLSVETEKAMYLSASQYMTLEADYGTRIRAANTFERMVTYGYGASASDYVFATDGIYYGGRKLIST